jgi:DNA-binding transcriptional regulator YiaG
MREWYELAFVPAGVASRPELMSIAPDREQLQRVIDEHAGAAVALDGILALTGLVGLTKAGCYVASYHTTDDVMMWTPSSVKPKGSPSNFTRPRKVTLKRRDRRRRGWKDRLLATDRKRVPQDDRAIGAELRAKREAAGISVREMSTRLGLSLAYLSYLERGRRQWSSLNRMSYVAMLSLTTHNTESTMRA